MFRNRDRRTSDRIPGLVKTLSCYLLLVLFCFQPVKRVQGQTSPDQAVLRGLAPMSVLYKTEDGRAALAANFVVTATIQNGTARQATLLPFPEQQQQALRDAFITHGDLAQLADGLGTTLGAAYTARAHYTSRTAFTSVSPRVAKLIAYANSTSAMHSNAGKYFFANGTTEGKTQVTPESLTILNGSGGQTDPFGRAYGKPAGSVGAGLYGNSRPFQTIPNVLLFSGRDYFGVPADNQTYNHGSMSDLTNSPSFPSGHTTYGYTGALLLAVLLPERYQEMIARGAEYGNDRIIMGAHYAMDVLGGRTLALYDFAHLLANDPAYMGRTVGSVAPIQDFREALGEARADTVKIVEAACGKPAAVCAKEDTGRFSDPAVTETFYDSTQTYGLPVVYQKTHGLTENVRTLAPEAGYLLTVAFPSLTLSQADDILTETEGPGGGFLDDGSAFGIYSRLNLYAAAGKAAQAVVGEHINKK